MLCNCNYYAFRSISQTNYQCVRRFGCPYLSRGISHAGGIGMKGLELLLHSGPEELLLFDRFPLRYLFHAIDIGIILVFGWNGLREAALAFQDAEE